MPSVDNRVVRMEFDNATFQTKVAQTIKSLADLDKALKLEGAHKGLTDISAAAGRVNLGPLQTAVQSVSTSFLALSTIAITALSNITSQALRSAAAISSSFTLDPIREGFSEFELQMGSIQTILANTRREGTQLSDVTAALDELNHFADQTIYNFGQMTKNIGTFTAAGVDLQTSTESIKGIANLAALSGSSAEQAASAMYQLSQAISTGTLRLIDWNSVVNAGMGGEVFQRALFDTAVAMGTITNAPVGTTFDEWTAAGNSFRDSLESGWLTAEVLTTTLGQFTGDMTEAQLLAIGFTKEQAAEILALGQTAVESATKVRTLSQLMTTLKEGLSSGWAQSFRIILGDFEEATQLFTGLSQSIGGFFQRQTEARNAVLQGWADLGGRTELLRGLENAFGNIFEVLARVGQAFRDIFPATTAQRLFDITKNFADFMASLRPSEQTLNNIKRIFTGVFAALDLGWETIKAGVGFIKDLVVQLTGLGSGKYLEGAADILDFFTRLRDSLDGGEAIQRFFDRLTESLQKPIQFIKDLKEELFGFFEGLGGGAGAAAEAGVDRISERFEGLQTVFERLGAVGDVLRTAFEGILTVLNTVGDAIIDWFQELGDKLREAMDPAEFDAILDALNVSLLGGIALLISKFLSGGLSFDFGGGFFSNISGAIEQLTGVLDAMQTQLRADALLKIAIAVGVLAASMVALSLIDSAALTRALIAMAVGFGQLIASFAILNTLTTNIGGAAGFAVLAAGMILLSTAIVILSGAVVILAQLSWEELLRGLTGLTILLAGITGAAVILSANVGSLIGAAVGLTAMAVALNLLIIPVVALAQLNWRDLATGIGAVAALLGVLVAAGIILSKNAGGLILAGAGLVAMAFALDLLAAAVAGLAQLDWDELAKGIGAVVVLLAALVAAGIILSKNAGGLVLAAAGLVGIAVALDILVAAIAAMALMDWGDLIKGLVGVTAALLILAVAAHAMSGTLTGAASIIIISVALGILAKVLEEMADIPFGDLLKALLGIALALTVFGVAALLLQPVIPALIGLGVALALIGGAFALFGAGAFLVAKAFQIIADAGPDAAESLKAALETIAGAIPAFVAGVAEGILELIQVFADAAGPLAEAAGVLILHIVETITELLPMFKDLFIGLIDLIIGVLDEKGPDLIQAGFDLLMNLLDGMAENIEEIVDVAADIIVKFLDELATHQVEITTAGVNVLVQFINGITQNVALIVQAVTNLITTFILSLANSQQQIIDAGFQVLTNFLLGISNNILSVITTVGTIITTFIQAVGALATDIATAGTDALVDFLGGMTDNAYKVTEAVGTLITTFITAVSNQAANIISSGANAIINFVQGLGREAGRVVTAGVNTIIQFIQGIGQNAVRLASAAFDVVTDFLNALADVIRRKSPELRAAGANIAAAIADGFTGGLASKARSMAEAAVSTAQGVKDKVEDFLGIGSPSKVFAEIGRFVGDGFAEGLADTRAVTASAETLANSAVTSFQTILSGLAAEMGNLEEIEPTITPVLDLTRVQADATKISGYIDDIKPLVPTTSLNQAQVIASSPAPNQTPVDNKNFKPEGGVTFIQNNNSPEMLDVGTIYKNTRNQITLAKEELDIS